MNKKKNQKMLNSLRILGKKTCTLSRVLQPFYSSTRMLSTLQSPEFPSERDQELVNDEFYELMDDSTVQELNEALEEPSPVFSFINPFILYFKYEPLDLLPKQIQKDPAIADRMQEYYV